MKLHNRLELREPLPIREVIAWLTGQLSQGFSDTAMVRVGKTTGQIQVLLVDEERPDVYDDSAQAKRPMWPTPAEQT